jgi:hypothetical protein
MNTRLKDAVRTALLFSALSIGTNLPGWSDDTSIGSSNSEIKLGEPVRLPQDAKSLRGPDVADFDGDGKLDLVSGSYEGKIFFSQSTGTADSLKFRSEVALQTGGQDIKLKHW